VTVDFLYCGKNGALWTDVVLVLNQCDSSWLKIFRGAKVTLVLESWMMCNCCGPMLWVLNVFQAQLALC